MHQLPTGHKSAFCAAAVAVALAAAMLLLAVVVVAACCLRLPLVKIKKNFARFASVSKNWSLFVIMKIA